MFKSVEGLVAKELLKLLAGELTAAARICETDWSAAGTTHLDLNVLLCAWLAEEMCRVAVAIRHPVCREVIVTTLTIRWVSFARWTLYQSKEAIVKEARLYAPLAHFALQFRLS